MDVPKVAKRLSRVAKKWSSWKIGEEDRDGEGPDQCSENWEIGEEERDG